MDIFYYSNYCKHSSKIIQFLVKANLVDSLSCICVDKLKKNPNTNQMMIVLENGNMVPLPPNVHEVPSLIAVNKSYQLILGDDIIKYFEPKVKEKLSSQNFEVGEPVGFPISMISGSGGSNIVSEQYTNYNMTPQELSSKGNSSNRQLYNYVPYDQNNNPIETPPDTYRPDKIASGVTIENLEQQRNSEIPQFNKNPLYQYQTTK